MSWKTDTEAAASKAPREEEDGLENWQAGKQASGNSLADILKDRQRSRHTDSQPRIKDQPTDRRTDRHRDRRTEDTAVGVVARHSQRLVEDPVVPMLHVTHDAGEALHRLPPVQHVGSAHQEERVVHLHYAGVAHRLRQRVLERPAAQQYTHTHTHTHTHTRTHARTHARAHARTHAHTHTHTHIHTAPVLTSGCVSPVWMSCLSSLSDVNVITDGAGNTSSSARQPFVWSGLVWSI